MKVISSEPWHDQQWMIEVETGWLFWKRRRTFIGSVTVWHESPDGRRPGTLMEGVLADIYARRNWRTPPPENKSNIPMSKVWVKIPGTGLEVLKEKPKKPRPLSLQEAYMRALVSMHIPIRDIDRP